MTDGGDEGFGAEFAPVGAEHEVPRLRKGALRRGKEEHPADNDKEHRHQKEIELFDTAFDPPDDDGGDDDKREGMVEDLRRDARAEHSLEERGRLLSRGRKIAQRHGDIVKDPPDDDGVERHDEQARKGHKTAPFPRRLVPRRQLLEGRHGVAACQIADEQLGDHDRKAYQHDRHQVDRYERAAAEFARDIGKLPDIPQPDRAPRGGENESYPAETCYFHRCSCVRIATAHLNKKVLTKGLTSVIISPH